VLKGADIVCISSIDWDFVWQGPQTVMAALAEAGNRVLFIDNTGVRPPRVRDLPRVRHRLANWRRGVKGFRHERPTLWVYSPILLPFPYSRLVRAANRWLLLRSLRRWMRATGFRPTVAWTFLPTPLARDLVADLGAEVTVYYCYGDFVASSAAARRVARSEAETFRDADLVFAVSDALAARARRYRADVHVFPPGVDLARFERARQAEGGDVPADLRALPGPVAGYVGGIHHWIDEALLAETARRLPGVSFALVGPVQTDVRALRALPNVHLLGPRPHDALPRYLAGFHVGIIPYRVAGYTDDVYPSKLFEYLAMELPVVSTDLAAVRAFGARHPGTVAVAADAAAFAEAIAAATRPATPLELKARVEAARAHDWADRVRRMSDLVATALAERRRRGTRGWEAALARLYRRTPRRAAGMAAIVLAAYLLLFHTPLLWIGAEPLRRSQPPRRADAIVVFAGGVGESGQAGQGYQERVEWAIDLYRGGWASNIVLSSGTRHAFSEVEVMQALAVSRGVPASAIVLEDRAASTMENVRFSADIMARHGWRSALVVSSPYHMRRASLVFRRIAPEVEAVYTPVPRTGFFSERRWGASWAQIRAILHEYVAIAYYRWMGWA
jgi:uncharacterized SAM-binding protein YcdF (DUF218 family)/glycosyltransferase involved in cell wall biosynthesis